MAQSWVNDDGLLVRYGTDQGQRGARPGSTQSNSKEQEFILEVDLTRVADGVIYSVDLDNDGVEDGFGGLDAAIPANAVIEGVRVIELVAPDGGTSFAVGTYQEDGTVIDADGLWTDLGAEGDDVGTQYASKAYVAVAVTGTYTAGLVKVIVNYYTV